VLLHEISNHYGDDMAIYFQRRSQRHLFTDKRVTNCCRWSFPLFFLHSIADASHHLLGFSFHLSGSISTRRHLVTPRIDDDRLITMASRRCIDSTVDTVRLSDDLSHQPISIKGMALPFMKVAIE